MEALIPTLPLATTSIISLQPVRFKLNHQSTRLMPGEKDYSVWVGDLTPDVDDLSLFKFFSARFQSVKSAKGTSPLTRGQHVWAELCNVPEMWVPFWINCATYLFIKVAAMIPKVFSLYSLLKTTSTQNMVFMF